MGVAAGIVTSVGVAVGLPATTWVAANAITIFGVGCTVGNVEVSGLLHEHKISIAKTAQLRLKLVTLQILVNFISSRPSKMMIHVITGPRLAFR